MRQPRPKARVARFAAPTPDPQNAVPLRADHPALSAGRTIFPGAVQPVRVAKRLLISGVNNSKIGGSIEKGPWAGMPVYTLTLEERATCPTSCAVWADCYGNAMPWPKRWDHTDPEFLVRLEAEVTLLGYDHPDGFVVRLHVLGDFYSASYVYFWARMLARVRALRVYGYTARTVLDADPASARTARAIAVLADYMWARFAVRTSSRNPDVADSRAIVVDADPDREDVIVCPAQTGATEACSTCGLCWSPNARGKTIAFLRHGMKRAAGPRDAHPDKRAIDPPSPARSPLQASGAKTAQERTRDAIMAAAPALFAAHPNGATAADVMKAIGVFGIDGAYSRTTTALAQLDRSGLLRWEYGSGKSSKLMRPLDWAPDADAPAGHDGLSAAQAAVLDAMKAAAVRGRCTLGRSELVKRAGVNPASFGIIADALESKRRITVERGGKGRPNTYRILGADASDERDETPEKTPQKPPLAPPPVRAAPRVTTSVLAAPEAVARPDRVERGVDFSDLEEKYGARSGRRPLTAIRRNDCHWPVGEPDPVQLYCGDPSVHGGEYCRAHTEKMFARKSAAGAPRHV